MNVQLFQRLAHAPESQLVEIYEDYLLERDASYFSIEATAGERRKRKVLSSLPQVAVYSDLNRNQTGLADPCQSVPYQGRSPSISRSEAGFRDTTCSSLPQFELASILPNSRKLYDVVTLQTYAADFPSKVGWRKQSLGMQNVVSPAGSARICEGVGLRQILQREDH